MIRYAVEVTLTEPMLGTVPKNREVYSKFIEDKKDDLARERQKAAGEPLEVETVTEADEARGWTGFHSDEHGLFVYDYFIRGALKNAGNVLKDGIGVKAARSKIDNYLFVFPRRVRILADGNGPEGNTANALFKPDGCVERPLRAQTMQGPRVTLAKSDSINAGRVMRFEIRVIEGCPIQHIDRFLEKCMEYWQYCGFGQFRNGSYGRASFKMKLMEEK